MKRIVLVVFALFVAGVSHAASNYGFVNVSSTTATSVVGVNSARRGLTLFNNGGQTVYCGFSTAVSTSTAMPIAPTASYEWAGDYTAWRGEVYCLAAAQSSGVNLRYWEWSR